VNNLRGIEVEIEVVDASVLECDVLALKYAQALYGLDKQIVHLLEPSEPAIRAELPPPSGFRLYPSPFHTGPRAFLVVGLPTLRNVLYDELQDFAARALASLAARAPEAKVVGLTLHGPGYGLDERYCFEAMLSGIQSAIDSGDCPAELTRIAFAELNRGRAERMRGYLANFIAAEESGPAARSSNTVFVAMPFADEFSDVYDYGIQGALHGLDLKCERIDQLSFTGDVVDEIRRRIGRSLLVVADLTTANPNVYLEVGYAWASGIDTVLVVRDAADLTFDTRTQRCLVYSSIRDLELKLKEEVRSLLLDRNDHGTTGGVSRDS
jgi:hypothetical protein